MAVFLLGAEPVQVLHICRRLVRQLTTSSGAVSLTYRSYWRGCRGLQLSSPASDLIQVLTVLQIHTLKSS